MIILQPPFHTTLLVLEKRCEMPQECEYSHFEIQAYILLPWNNHTKLTRKCCIHNRQKRCLGIIDQGLSVVRPKFLGSGSCLGIMLFSEAVYIN